MNCREFRTRFNQEGAFQALSPEMREHLNGCEDCARIAEAERILKTAIESSPDIPITAAVSFDEMKKRIRSEAQRPAFIQRRRIWLYPAISAVAALVVTIAALLPGKKPGVVGYGVALSGVEPGIIENSNMMCDMLMKLGLYDADIEAVGCDSTCNFNVVRLKSESEARLVISTVSTLQPEQVRAKIFPIHKGDTSHTAFGDAVL